MLAALTQLRPQIVRWHLDAVLAAIPRVETFDGRSPHWRFLVYSPSSRQGVLFSLVAPPLEVSDNDRNLQLVTVALQKFPRLAEIKPTRLIDSDRAFFLATHHDLLPDTKGMLSLQFVLVPAPRYVFQNPETNDTLTIDPVTGFVTTR